MPLVDNLEIITGLVAVLVEDSGMMLVEFSVVLFRMVLRMVLKEDFGMVLVKILEEELEMMLVGDF